MLELEYCRILEAVDGMFGEGEEPAVATDPQGRQSILTSSQSKEALLIYRAQTDFLRDRRLDHEMKLEGSYYDEKGKQQREKKRGKE